MNVLGLTFVSSLAVGIPTYWALPRPWRLPATAALALALLAWSAPASAIFCLTLAFSSYCIARRSHDLNLAYWAAAAMFLALLLFREALTHTTDGSSIVPWLGAAFFSLRAIHYVIANAQQKLPPHRLTDYLCYLFFLPTLLVGPVQGFADFERETRRCRFDAQQFSAGIERVLFGYAKVVLLADYLVGLKLNFLVETMDPGALRAYLECLEYGMGLYFKFAGYSDVAIGLGLLMGIRLPENFHYPFLALNIADFWRRWNASVSAWCREHVSFPLYAKTRNTAVSALAAMLVLGLWHECSLRYLLWGGYHGCGILLWQRWHRLANAQGWQAGPRWHAISNVASVFLTFNFVVVGFAITRTADANQALITLHRLLW